MSSDSEFPKDPNRTAAERPRPQGREHEPEASSVVDSDLPQRIGPFRLLAKLGEGGMGVVYRAEQLAPVRREVALKVVRGSLRSVAAQERFKAERQALARLDHPSISRLYEAGTTELQEPWFAMELVEGEGLLAYCDRRKLDLRARVAILIDVAKAVEFAHRKGILHRDLKPGNILVSEVDGEPVPKIIDFGIAKSLDQPLSEGTLATQHGAIGTPHYMSPEALLRPQEVDTRSDVFSLGVIAYRLLAGVFPRGTGGESLANVILMSTAELPGLAQRFAACDKPERDQIAAARGISEKELRDTLGGELGWIARTATAESPDERYDSAAAFGEDLRRFLEHLPLTVAPPSVWYRTRKFVRRHRIGVVSAAAILLALMAGGIATGLALREARRSLQEAQAVAGYLADLFSSASAWSSNPKGMPVDQVVLAGVERIDAELRDQPRARARLLNVLANVVQDLGHREKSIELRRQAIALREVLYGSDSLEVADSLDSLGVTLMYEKDLAEAEAVLERANEIRVLREGPESRSLARGYADLADVFIRKKEYERAESLLRESVRLAEKSSGIPSQEHGAKQQRLASVLGLEKKDDEAVRRFRSAIAELALDRENHRYEYARALDDYGNFLVERHRAAAALALFAKARPILEDIWGAGASRLIPILNDIGRCHLDLGQPEEALRSYQDAFAIIEKELGRRSDAGAVLLHNMAEIRRDHGQLEQAKKQFEESRSIFLELVGADGLAIGISLASEGLLDLRRSDPAAAEKKFHRALEIFEKHGASNDENAANCYWGLGQIDLVRGHRRRALAELERAVEIRDRVLPPDHADRVRAHEDYERALAAK